MKTHVVKTYPSFFESVSQDIKTFEVRKNDRDYKVGDCLHLKEYRPGEEVYTGRELKRFVCCIIKGGQFGIEQGYCVMGLSYHHPAGHK